jgi:hypothetical protein
MAPIVEDQLGEEVRHRYQNEPRAIQMILEPDFFSPWGRREFSEIFSCGLPFETCREAFDAIILIS